MTTLSSQQPPALLKKISTKLQESRPEAHSVNYGLEAWQRCFPVDKDFFAINSRLGERLTRGNVTTWQRG